MSSPTEQETSGWGNTAGKQLLLQYFKSGSHIADLGCGNGWLEKECANAPFSISAIDLPECDFNVSPLPYESNSLDGAVAFQVVEHLENPHFFVREVFRVLKPDGIFIVSMPNPFHIFNKLSFIINHEFYRYTNMNDHKYVASQAIFAKLFKNFSIQKVFYRKGIFPYRALARLRLPENVAFGQDICFILVKK